MEYVGIDYHTRYAIATRMDADGVILSKDKIPNLRDNIRSYFAKLPSGSRAVLEATNNWACFVEWTQDLPIDIKLANPGKTKAIASAKIKQGSANLRFALLQAIPHLVRKHKGLARHYLRISRKKGTKTARIAISRKLLAIMLTMLKERSVFRIDKPTKEKPNIACLSASARASVSL